MQLLPGLSLSRSPALAAGPGDTTRMVSSPGDILLSHPACGHSSEGFRANTSSLKFFTLGFGLVFIYSLHQENTGTFSTWRRWSL